MLANKTVLVTGAVQGIGQVVAFLLSEQATIIRGQSIIADGGDTPY